MKKAAKSANRAAKKMNKVITLGQQAADHLEAAGDGWFIHEAELLAAADAAEEAAADLRERALHASVAHSAAYEGAAALRGTATI